MFRLLLSLAIIPLGFGGGVPSAPKPQPIPQQQDLQVISARDSERLRRRSAASKTTLSPLKEGSLTPQPLKNVMGA